MRSLQGQDAPPRCPGQLSAVLLPDAPFPLAQLVAEHLAALPWPRPRFYKGSSPLPLLSCCYWFYLICCPESVAVSYKPARFACVIVLLSRWRFSSGYLVLIWFSYCLCGDPGEEVLHSNFPGVLSHLNSATVSCAQLSEYGTWLRHILQNAFSVSPSEFHLNGFQIIHLLEAGKFSLVM